MVTRRLEKVEFATSADERTNKKFLPRHSEACNKFRKEGELIKSGTAVVVGQVSNLHHPQSIIFYTLEDSHSHHEVK